MWKQSKKMVGCLQQKCNFVNELTIYQFGLFELRDRDRDRKRERKRERKKECHLCVFRSTNLQIIELHLFDGSLVDFCENIYDICPSYLEIHSQTKLDVIFSSNCDSNENSDLEKEIPTAKIPQKSCSVKAHSFCHHQTKEEGKKHSKINFGHSIKHNKYSSASERKK